ncbi:PucR family transcriptional regulator [Brevibacterium samyangense]|uniref:PucR family transcriptional regulator n=1 Tax=Brevibacterium samyangense TaxID=366888 RepID=A0ABN2TBG6_9MICO
MQVRDLITDRLLRLTLATPSSGLSLGAEVAQAVVTESIDPGPYLEPHALVLTTGLALNFTDARIWDGYVERLVKARVSAIAFGTGTPHSDVPAGLLESARTHDLPVLEVPRDVPFLRLQQTVSTVLEHERFEITRLAWTIAEECTRMASAGDDLLEIIDYITRRSGLVVAICDDAGGVFLRSTGTGSDAAVETRTGSVSRGSADGFSGGLQVERRQVPLGLPLAVGREETWSLAVEVAVDVAGSIAGEGAGDRAGGASAGRPGSAGSIRWNEAAEKGRVVITNPEEARTLLSPAAAVIGMVLTRSLTSRMWRSDAADRLAAALERLDRGAVDEVAKAAAAFGIRSADGVVVMDLRARSRVRMHLVARRLVSALGAEHVVVPMESATRLRMLVAPRVLVDERVPEEGKPRIEATVADVVRGDVGDRLSMSAPATSWAEVVVACARLTVVGGAGGGARGGAAGAAASAGGVQVLESMVLGDVVEALPIVMREVVAQEVLGPVLSSPDSAALVASLRAIVETSSVAAAAVRMGAHRNTIRMHRDRIEQLLGLNLNDGADRALCLVAMEVVGREGSR